MSSHDCFGVKIFCRFCRQRGFDYHHHPNNCVTCYPCGRQGHLAKNCNGLTTQSPRRYPEVDNSSMLPDGEPVAIDVEKVQGDHGQMLAAWVAVTWNAPSRKR